MSKNLVFIDSRVTGYESLVSTFGTDTQWILLNASQDGVLQMQAALVGYSGLDSIQIVSHGSPGTLYLGTTTLTTENLAGYSSALTDIGASLSEGGDILLYGCSVGLGEIGAQFIDSLAQLTRADVAASDSVTWVDDLDLDGVQEVTCGLVGDALGVERLALLAANTAPTFIASDGTVVVPVGRSYDQANSIIQQTDGKLVVAGYSIGSNGLDFSLIRLNADGTLDRSFGSEGKLIVPVGAYTDIAHSIIQQTDGKLLVAGSSNSSNSYDFSLIRLNADGTLDSSFGSEGKLFVPNLGFGKSVIQQSDGKLVIAGSTLNNEFSLARLNVDGSLDNSFGVDGAVVFTQINFTDYGQRVVQQADGNLVVFGYRNIDNRTDFSLIRLKNDGTLDSTFGSGGNLTVPVGVNENTGYDIIQQTDGKLVASGSSFNGVDTDYSLIRLNEDGSLDDLFGLGGKLVVSVGVGWDEGYSVIQQADAKLVVVGVSSHEYGYDSNLIRVNEDGTLDSSFGVGGKLIVPVSEVVGYDLGNSVIQQADRKLVVAGYVENGGDRNFSIFRLNPDGSLDTAFSPAENTLTQAGPAAFRENASPTFLAASAQIQDFELAASGSYAGSTLTLSRQGGANPQDAFYNAGTLSVLSQGSFFAVDGVTIGRVTTNNNGTLALTFNTNATQSLVNKALQQITYSNTSDAPSTSVAIEWTFSDGNTGAQGTGSALSVTGTSYVTITPTNDAPYVTAAVPDQRVEVNAPFSYQLPAGTFIDPDLETLTYSVTMADGTGVPPWLTFNRTTQTFSGTPTADDLGSFDLQIKATDAAGVSAYDHVRFTVSVNTPPVLNVSFLPEPTGRNGMTVSIDSFQPINLGNGYTEYRVNYTEKNLTDTAIDQGTLRLYFETGEPAAHYGFFGRVLPGEAYQTGGSYRFVVESNRVPTFLQYDADHFFAQSPIEGALKWRVSDSALKLDGQSDVDPSSIQVIDTPFDDTFAVITGRALGDDVDPETVLVYGIKGGMDQGMVAFKAGLYGSLSVNKATGILSFAPDDAVVESVSATREEKYEVYVSDGVSESVQTVTIIVKGVKEAPFFGDINLSQSEDSTVSRILPADREVSPQLVYSLVSGVSHGTISLIPNGSYTYTPAANYSGTDSFTFKAYDGTADSNIATVSINVNAINDAPVLASALVDRSVKLGSSLNFAFNANTFTDVDSPTLSYTATLSNGNTLPSWLNFNAQTRTFSGTPKSSDLGTVSVKVTASDGFLSASDTFDVAVSERPNTSPTATNITATTNEDTLLTANLPKAIDAESDPVTYAKASTPAKGTVSVTADGSYTYTPTSNTHGSDSFRYTVTDDRGASNTYTVSLTINPVNDAPTLTAIAALTFVDTAEDNIFILEQPGQIQAQDLDSTTLTYGLVGGVLLAVDPGPNAVINPQSPFGIYSTLQGSYGNLHVHTGTGAYTFFPNNAAIQGLKANATETFIVTVSDGELSAQTPLTINIKGANDTPVLHEPIKDQMVFASSSWNFTLGISQFTDADAGETLTYSAKLANGDPLPAWLTFNPATRTFSGTPGSNDVEALPIAVTASDGSRSATDTFVLTIRALQEVNGNSANDQLQVQLGSTRVNAGAGTDTVQLPLFLNEFDLSPGNGNSAIGTYGKGYTLELNDVEFVQFGSSENTTKIALADLISGIAQERLGQLTDLYLAFFGRAPDVTGLEYWQRQLLDDELKSTGKSKDFAAIAMDFAWSQEAQALYPLNSANRDFVKIVYQNCFARDPDQGGWDYWTGVLNNKGQTDLNDRGAFVGEVILGAYASTSGAEDRDLLTNKHEVAMYYVNQLALMPQEGYDSAINALLGKITMAPETRIQAEKVIDYVFSDPVMLTGLMSNQPLLDLIWGA